MACDGEPDCACLSEVAPKKKQMGIAYAFARHVSQMSCGHMFEELQAQLSIGNLTEQVHPKKTTAMDGGTFDTELEVCQVSLHGEAERHSARVDEHSAGIGMNFDVCKKGEGIQLDEGIEDGNNLLASARGDGEKITAMSASRKVSTKARAEAARAQGRRP